MNITLIIISLMVTYSSYAQEIITNEEEIAAPENARVEESLILSFFGVASKSQNEVNNEFNAGFGAFIEFRGDDQMGLETGAFYINNQYVYSEGEAINVADVNRLHVPVMIKLWPVNFFNLGVGPYASFRVSDEDKLSNLETYEAVGDGSKDVEFGADVAATFIFSLDDSSGLFAGARYSLPFEQETRSRLENALAFTAGLTLAL